MSPAQAATSSSKSNGRTVVEYVPRAHILREFAVRAYEHTLDPRYLLQLCEDLQAPLQMVG